MYINCYNYTLKKIQKLATLSPCPILACIKDSGLRLLDTHTCLYSPAAASSSSLLALPLPRRPLYYLALQNLSFSIRQELL